MANPAVLIFSCEIVACPKRYANILDSREREVGGGKEDGKLWSLKIERIFFVRIFYLCICWKWGIEKNRIKGEARLCITRVIYHTPRPLVVTCVTPFEVSSMTPEAHRWCCVAVGKNLLFTRANYFFLFFFSLRIIIIVRLERIVNRRKGFGKFRNLKNVSELVPEIW